jgi:uncharacterized protein (UPF0210 family)
MIPTQSVVSHRIRPPLGVCHVPHLVAKCWLQSLRCCSEISNLEPDHECGPRPRSPAKDPGVQCGSRYCLAQTCAKTIRSLLLLLFIGLVFACQSRATDRPKVRAITAFVRLDTKNYRQELTTVAQSLDIAKKKFEQAGWEVETVRITMQPFPEFVRGLGREKALAVLLDLDSLASGNYACNIGPAMMQESDDPAMMDLLADFLARAKVTNGSAIVAADDGIHWEVIRRAAHVVKYVERNSPHGQGNFKFAATAMIAPYSPFYPGSYHTGSGGKFSIGLESANVVLDVLKETRNKPEEAARRLKEDLSRYAAGVESISQQFAAQVGWEYLGIDPTPTPAGEISIGAAVEAYTSHPFGSSGTLSTAFLITTAIRSIATKQVGYSGLMLPVLEDQRLAQRWSEGRISLDSLLSYSSVCATGLDTVPLPGDVSEEEIARILGDVASLAFKWRKPLSARLLPVAGKRAGERSNFDDPHLTNAKLQPLR